jgi:hypothetical protein
MVCEHAALLRYFTHIVLLKYVFISVSKFYNQSVYRTLHVSLPMCHANAVGVPSWLGSSSVCCGYVPEIRWCITVQVHQVNCKDTCWKYTPVYGCYRHTVSVRGNADFRRCWPTPGNCGFPYFTFFYVSLSPLDLRNGKGCIANENRKANNKREKHMKLGSAHIAWEFWRSCICIV